MFQSTYVKRLQKGDYKYIVDEIDDRFVSITSQWAKQMVVLHKLGYNLDYHLSGSRIHTPSETLEMESGDCQDQSVLMANLFLAAGFDVRILSLSHAEDDCGHISLQVRAPVSDASEATSQIRETNKNIFWTKPGKMAWSTVNDDPYFLADPEWSSYPGDRETLTGEYIVETGDGWDFYHIDDYWFVDADDGYCDVPAGVGPRCMEMG